MNERVVQRVGAWSSGVQRLVLLMACVALFGVWFIRMPLAEVDETRYATASRTMVETGNYLIPQYNGEPRYQKPILFYWLQSASMRLFGANEFAARLPSAVASTALVLLLHTFLLRWLPRAAGDDRIALAREAAFLGAAALATMPLFAIWARGGVTDVTLTLCMAGAAFSTFEAGMAADGHTVRRWYLAAAACCALAFLTKGPLGVLVPVLTWLLFHQRRGTLGAEIRRLPIGRMALLFLVIAAPWYLATALVDGPGFLRQFFLTENVNRFAGAHALPTFEQMGNTAVFLLVVTLFLHPYGAFALHDLRRHPAEHPSGALLDMRRFAWCWIAAAVGVIAFSHTQYPNYVQNMTPAVAIVFAVYLLRRPQLPATDRLSRAALLGFSTIWAATIPLMLWNARPAWLGKFDADPWSIPYPSHCALGCAVGAGVAGAALLAVTVWHRTPRIGQTMAAWMLLLAILLFGAAPLFFTSQSGAAAEVGLALRACAPLHTIAYARKFPENIVFYGHRQVTFYPSAVPASRDAIRRTLNRDTALLVITDPDSLPALRSLGQTKILRRFAYFQIVCLRRGAHPAD